MTTDRQVWSRRLANGDHSGRTLKVVHPRLEPKGGGRRQVLRC
jgi:hypothetical protein